MWTLTSILCTPQLQSTAYRWAQIFRQALGPNRTLHKWGLARSKDWWAISSESILHLPKLWVYTQTSQSLSHWWCTSTLKVIAVHCAARLCAPPPFCDWYESLHSYSRCVSLSISWCFYSSGGEARHNLAGAQSLGLLWFGFCTTELTVFAKHWATEYKSKWVRFITMENPPRCCPEAYMIVCVTK